MQLKQGLNVFLIIAVLLVGTILASVGIYLFTDYRLLIAFPLLGLIALCMVFLYLETHKKKEAVNTERERAELAEGYIKELQEYVSEQETANKSLKVKQRKVSPRGFSRCADRFA